MGFLDKLKESIAGNPTELVKEAEDQEYVELGGEHASKDDKVVVRSFTITDFDSVKVILEGLREGNMIAFINIKPLKDRDLVELKRAISKLKKTCDAIDGDIAGLGEDWIAATPSFASIQREQKTKESEPINSGEVTEYSSEPAPASTPEPAQPEPSSEPTTEGMTTAEAAQPAETQESEETKEDDNLKIEPY